VSSFTQPLSLTVATNGWSTDRELIYEIGRKGSGLCIFVPVGFVTDLASVPRFAWMIFAPSDAQYAAAAVLHDFLCTSPGFNRRMADCIFVEALEVLGIPRWRRLAMFYSVRLYACIKRKNK